MLDLKTACGLLVLLAAALPLQAQEDPLKSPACGSALAELRLARAEPATAARVESLRRQAATTCLGLAMAPARPSRALQPPVTVPPPAIDVPAPAAAIPGLPVLVPAPPAVAVERLPLPAACDGNGCWTDDGTHLRQVPPGLTGPSGPCLAQGGLVRCP